MIHGLLIEVAKEIGYVPKSRTVGGGGNDYGPKYNFRGIDEIMARCNPAFIAHGIVVSVETRNHQVTATPREEQGRDGKKIKTAYHATLQLAVRFTASDGSYIENVTAGEGTDTNNDKASYKALSGAYKYALTLGLCIPAAPDLLNDPDQSTADRSARRANGKQQSRPQQNNGVDHPTLSPGCLKAVTAIETAKDDQTFARYVEAVNKRIENGEYTAAEVQLVEGAIDKKAHALSAAVK